MSLLRVCLIEGYWVPAQWSMQLYAQEVFTALEPFRDRIEVVRISAGSASSAPGRRLERLPGGFRFARRLAQWVILPTALRSHPSEVYHCMEPGDVFATRRLSPRQVIVTCHDLIPWRLRAMARKSQPVPWLSKQLYHQMGNLLRRVARIITPSECTRQDVVEFLGIGPERVRVIPYRLQPVFAPVPPVERDRYREELRRKHRLPAGPWFLHVGSTLFYKNVETLLNALARTEAFLLRVGNGLTPAQEALARRLGLAGRIFCLGELTPAELARIYPAVDALVLPSWYEGFGRPALEAMACGAAVIAGNAGALPEVVGKAGLLVDPSDPEALAVVMKRLIEDEALRAHLEAAGIEQARAFQQRDLGADLSEVYREVDTSARGSGILS